MMSLFRALVIAVSLALPVSGCAAALAALPQVTAVVTDALVVLNIIDAAVQDHFDQNPMTPPHVQREYAKALRDAVVALKAAEDALRGAESLSQEDYDRAFQQFREAYGKLLELLEKNGLVRQGYLMAGKGGGTPAHLPEPAALTYQVK